MSNKPSTMKRFLSLLFIFALLISVANPLKGQASKTSTIVDLITVYQADYGALSRKYAVNPTNEHFDRFDKFYSDWLKKLDGINFNGLNQSEKIDFTLFKNDLTSSHYFLKAERKQYQEISSYLPATDSIMEFINQRRVGTSMKGREIADRFNTWEKEISQKKSELEQTILLSKRNASYLSRAIRELGEGIKEAYGFYFGYDPDFTWWVEEPYKALSESMKTYGEFAGNYYDAEKESVDESGIVGNPIGRDEIIQRLRFQMISYNPEELIEIAEKQYEWTLKEMLKASQELGYGDDWKAAMEYVKTTHVDEGEQPPLVKELADEAVNFLEERDLVTIPDS